MVLPRDKRNGARWRGLLFGILLALTAGGCQPNGEARKPVFPVRGQVFARDKPAAGAFLVLVPLNEPPDAKDPRPRAEVDQDGSFTLGTYEQSDGAPAGEYVVIITWKGGVLPDGREEPEDKLFGRYADPAKSNLRASVREGPNELPAFRLK